MPKRLVQIAIGGPVLMDADELAKYLEPIGEWLSISSHAWVLSTEHDYETIRKTIHAVPFLVNASLFMSDVNLDYADGWLPEVIWDWLEERAAGKG